MRKPHLAASACSLAGSFAAGAPGTAALKKCMRVASITKKRPRKVRSENADRNFLCDLEGKDSDLNIKDQVPCRAHPVFFVDRWARCKSKGLCFLQEFNGLALAAGVFYFAAGALADKAAEKSYICSL